MFCAVEPSLAVLAYVSTPDRSVTLAPAPANDTRALTAALIALEPVGFSFSSRRHDAIGLICEFSDSEVHTCRLIQNRRLRLRRVHRNRLATNRVRQRLHRRIRRVGNAFHLRFLMLGNRSRPRVLTGDMCNLDGPPESRQHSIALRDIRTIGRSWGDAPHRVATS